MLFDVHLGLELCVKVLKSFQLRTTQKGNLAFQAGNKAYYEDITLIEKDSPVTLITAYDAHARFLVNY